MIDHNLIFIILVPVVYFGAIAYILKRKQFICYFLFNIICFLMFIRLFELNSELFSIVNSLIGFNLVVPNSYHIFNFIQDSYLLAYIYTPIFCYYVTQYQESNSKIFTVLKWLNIAIILFMFFLGKITIVYVYFVLSLLVLTLFKLEHLWKRALQATSIALGLFSLFFNLGYYIADICSGKNTGFCKTLFSYHSILNYEFSGLYALLVLIWSIFLITGVASVVLKSILTPTISAKN